MVSWVLYAVAVFFLLGIRIVKQYERGVKFRLGKYTRTLQPGFNWIIPVIESVDKVDMRITTLDVPSQEVITKDNVPVKINAVVYFKVTNAEKAVIEIRGYQFAISQLAQSSLRDVVGKVELDTVLAERETLGKKIRNHVDKMTDPWGIEVTAVEIKDAELPDTMKRAMARQAESERDRRSRIILAEGENQAAKKLADAAKVIAKNPEALHLRLFQTLSDVAAEKNSTIIVPVPTELLEFLRGAGKKKK